MWNLILNWMKLLLKTVGDIPTIRKGLTFYLNKNITHSFSGEVTRSREAMWFAKITQWVNVRAKSKTKSDLHPGVIRTLLSWVTSWRPLRKYFTEQEIAPIYGYSWDHFFRSVFYPFLLLSSLLFSVFLINLNLFLKSYAWLLSWTAKVSDNRFKQPKIKIENW